MSGKEIPVQKQEKVGFYGWFAALLCLLTLAVSLTCRNVWNSSIAIPGMLESVNMNALQAGSVSSALYFGMVISSLCCGFVIDKWGPKLVMVITAIGTGLTTVFVPMVDSYTAVMLLRFLAGVFCGPVFASISKMNYGYFPDKLRGIAQTVIMAGTPLGVAFTAAVLAPYIANNTWQAGFRLASCIAIVVGVLVLVFGRERGLAQATKKLSLSEEEKAQQTKLALKVFLQKDFVITMIIQFMIVGASFALQTWILAFFINVHGLSIAVAGAVFGLETILSLICGPIAGILSDLLKTRKWVLFFGALGSALLIMAYTFSSRIGYLTVIASILPFFRAFMGQMPNIMQLERAKGPYAGKVMGWYNAICMFGSVVFNVIFGAIINATGSYFSILVFVSVCFILCGVLGAFVKDTYVKSKTTV